MSRKARKKPVKQGYRPASPTTSPPSRQNLSTSEKVIQVLLVAVKLVYLLIWVTAKDGAIIGMLNTVLRYIHYILERKEK